MRTTVLFTALTGLIVLLNGCGDTANNSTAASTANEATANERESLPTDTTVAAITDEEMQEIDAYLSSNQASDNNQASSTTDNDPNSSVVNTHQNIVNLTDAVRPFSIELMSPHSYIGLEGELMVDVIQDNAVFIDVFIEDAEGRLVKDAKPEVQLTGSSQIISASGNQLESEPENGSENSSSTDDNDGFAFGVVGGEMGEDQVRVTLEDASATVLVNVMSSEAMNYANLPVIDGVLPWDLLMQATVSWQEKISVAFPPEISQQTGQTVKLAGFMMPLEMSEQQSHFLITANPPSCFFHIPGGPTGAVEVFADRPVDITWDPIVLEGRFEALETSDIGIAYRLHEANLIENP